MPPRPTPAALLAPLASLASLALPAAAAAQTVTGQVVDGADGAPLAHAVVTLVDTARLRRGGVLTDSAGRFTLAAPAPGTYTVRAERVGSASTSSEPLALAAGDTARVHLVMGAAARLSAVRVTARERCRVRPAEGEAAARLWDEARKALVGTQLGEAGAPSVRLGRFTREIEPDRKTVRRELWTLSSSGAHSFRSVDVAELGTRGFVEPAMSAAGTDSVIYHAPDAEVLLSDAFLESHCLRAVAPPGSRRGQLGLAVEPVPQRDKKDRRADVRGTLWIDTASFELRDFEFEYTDLPPNVPEGRAGGMVGFARRADGAWYVDRWMISMPVQEVVGHLRPPTYSLHAPHARAVREEEVVQRVTETGGRAIVTGATTRRTAPTVLSGTMRDSSAAGGPVPLTDGRVLVLGTPFQALLNDAGEFYLEVPRAGDFLVRFEAPRATSLGIGWTQLLPLRPGRELRIEAAIPGPPTLRAAHCEGAAARDTVAPLLTGVVREWRAEGVSAAPTLRPAAGASVEVEWREPNWPADWKERRTVRADAQGTYRLCELPAGAAVGLRAKRGRAASEQWVGLAERGGVLTRDFVLLPERALGARP
jgi:hypothetical protein